MTSKAQWGNGNQIPSPYMVIPLSWRLKSHQQNPNNISNIRFPYKGRIQVHQGKLRVSLLMSCTYITESKTIWSFCCSYARALVIVFCVFKSFLASSNVRHRHWWWVSKEMSLNIEKWQKDPEILMTKKVYGRIFISFSSESEIVVYINCQIEDVENHLQRIYV